MLRKHYVPGSHGNQGSPKRSSPWCVGHFCLCFQVLLRLVAFPHGLSRYPWQTVGVESRRVHDALPLGPLSATADCTFPPDLPRSLWTLTFCHVLSRFPTVKRGRRVVFKPVYAHGIKKRSQSCCKHFILNL